jgi:hypothetical protein
MLARFGKRLLATYVRIIDVPRAIPGESHHRLVARWARRRAAPAGHLHRCLPGNCTGVWGLAAHRDPRALGAGCDTRQGNRTTDAHRSTLMVRDQRGSAAHRARSAGFGPERPCRPPAHLCASVVPIACFPARRFCAAPPAVEIRPAGCSPAHRAVPFWCMGSCRHAIRPTRVRSGAATGVRSNAAIGVRSSAATGAMNNHPGLRPIRVFCVHPPVSALNLSCVAACRTGRPWNR